jgi:hypothetical protein
MDLGVTSLGPRTKTVRILGNNFVLSEPSAEGLANYLDLQRGLANELLAISQHLASLLEKASEDGKKDLDPELIAQITKEETEARKKIDDTSLMLFILRSTPSNPPVDEDFVKKNMTLTMKQTLVEYMDGVCGIEDKEKNVMSLLFPSLSVLKRRA